MATCTAEPAEMVYSPMELDAVLRPRLPHLGDSPVDDRTDPAADVLGFYADSVLVTGIPMTADNLAARAPVSQVASVDRRTELAHGSRPPGVCCWSLLRARQARQVESVRHTARRVEVTSRQLKIRVSEILSVDGGKITDVG